MLIYDQGFPSGYRQDSHGPNVQAAVAQILQKLTTPSMRGLLPWDLAQGLQAVLGDGQTAVHPCQISSRCVMVAYDDRASDPAKGSPYAYTGGPCIWLCQRSFDEGQDRVNAVLFHELVHVLCGWELDAEVFENLWFGGQGATLPDAGDLDVFARRNWKGRWVRVVKDATNDVVIENSWGEKILSLRHDLPDFFGQLTPDDLAGIPNG